MYQNFGASLVDLPPVLFLFLEYRRSLVYYLGCLKQLSVSTSKGGWLNLDIIIPTLHFIIVLSDLPDGLSTFESAGLT